MRDMLGKVTGLSLCAVDGKGNILTETTSMASLCRSLKRDAAYEPVCAAATRYGLDMAASHQGRFTFFCPCGFIRSVIPVMHGNRCLGGFFIGQVLSPNAPDGTPQLQRLLTPEHSAILQKQHISDLFNATSVYDFSYFAYIGELAAGIIHEAAAKEISAANRDAGNASTLAMLRAKTAMLEQKLSVRESMLTQWRSQMNLDFFINALSSLSGLAAFEDSPRTQEMCLLLAEHLRHRLNDHAGFISLREEMLAVRSFLGIQQGKFGENIRYAVSLPPELEGCPFPAQTLLPFVEAAILRGLCLQDGGYDFSLTVQREGAEIVLLLRDNAPGGSAFGGTDPTHAFPGGEAAASALTAAILRLETLLGPQHDVRVFTDEEGSTSCIRYTPPIGEGA
jgi:ligand-binding sensor protein